MKRVRWGRVAGFYGIAVAGISAIGGLLYLLGEVGPLVSTVLAAVAMFSPCVATVCMNRLDGASSFDGLAKLLFNRWLLAAMGIPVLAAGLIGAVGALLPGSTVDLTLMGFLDQYASLMTPEELGQAREQLQALPGGPATAVLLSLPQVVIAGATVNAVFAFGEEVGWRGWLYRELESLGFWRANLLIGLLWGFWHAPLILNGHNYPAHPVEGVFLFSAVCMAMSPLLGWLRERGGSVWHAAVFHGVVNASAGLPMMVVLGSDLVVGLPGLAGLVVFGGLSGLLLARR